MKQKTMTKGRNVMLSAVIIIALLALATVAAMIPRARQSASAHIVSGNTVNIAWTSNDLTFSFVESTDHAWDVSNLCEKQLKNGNVEYLLFEGEVSSINNVLNNAFLWIPKVVGYRSSSTQYEHRPLDVLRSKLKLNTVYTIFVITSYIGVANFVNDGGETLDLYPDDCCLHAHAQRIFRYNPMSLPANPTKTGYTFVGWYTDEALTQPYNYNEIVLDVNLYAKFKPIEYTVSFVTNNSATMSPLKVNYNTLITPPVLERYGYAFDGWFSDSALTLAYDSATPVTGSMTLYAKWTPLTYTVTFYVDGEVYHAVTVPYGTTFGDAALREYLAAGDITLDGAAIAADYSISGDVSVNLALSDAMSNWLAVGNWLTKYWIWPTVGVVLLIGGAIAIAVAVKVKRG